MDISAPANAIEYHPALLAHADENAATTTTPVVAPLPPLPVETTELVVQPSAQPVLDSASDGGGSISGGSDNDDDLDDIDDDDDLDDDDDDDLDDDDDDESMFSTDDDDDEDDDYACMSPGDRAENEKFGLEYEGPKLIDKDARRLLTLMLHASTCPCRYVRKQRCVNTMKWFAFPWSLFQQRSDSRFLHRFYMVVTSDDARPVQA